MIDLTALQELADWMRDQGASYARVGDIELELFEQEPDDEYSFQDIEEALKKVNAPPAKEYTSPYEDEDLYGGGEVPRLPKVKGGDHAE